MYLSKKAKIKMSVIYFTSEMVLPLPHTQFTSKLIQHTKTYPSLLLENIVNVFSKTKHITSIKCMIIVLVELD